MSKICDFLSLPAFYLIVVLAYDLIYTLAQSQDQGCASRLAIICNQFLMAETVIKKKNTISSYFFTVS